MFLCIVCIDLFLVSPPDTPCLPPNIDALSLARRGRSCSLCACSSASRLLLLCACALLCCFLSCAAAPAYPQSAVYFLAGARSFFGMLLMPYWRVGGMGRMLAMPSRWLTRSDGCAPTDTQYRTRSLFTRSSFTPSVAAIGLNVPSYRSSHTIDKRPFVH